MTEHNILYTVLVTYDELYSNGVVYMYMDYLLTMPTHSLYSV